MIFLNPPNPPRISVVNCDLELKHSHSTWGTEPPLFLVIAGVLVLTLERWGGHIPYHSALSGVSHYFRVPSSWEHGDDTPTLARSRVGNCTGSQQEDLIRLQSESENTIYSDLDMCSCSGTCQQEDLIRLQVRVRTPYTLILDVRSGSSTCQESAPTSNGKKHLTRIMARSPLYCFRGAMKACAWGRELAPASRIPMSPADERSSRAWTGRIVHLDM